MIPAAKHGLNLPIELLEPIGCEVEPGWVFPAGSRAQLPMGSRQRQTASQRFSAEGDGTTFWATNAVFTSPVMCWIWICLQRKGGVFTLSQPLLHPSCVMAHGAGRPSLLIGQTCPICVQSPQPCMSSRGTTNQDGVTPLFHLASFISRAAVDRAAEIVEPSASAASFPTSLPLQFTAW